jgi:IS30 family transposase
VYNEVTTTKHLQEVAMLSYKHFTLDERKYLQELLAEGYSMRKAADALGRSPSSVSREIKRNRSITPIKPSNNPYNYHHWRANTLATIRRRQKVCRAIPKDSELYSYITDNLNCFWTPEQIAKRWRKEHPDSHVAVSTIYRYIKHHEFDGISAKTHLRRRGKNIHYVHKNSYTIHPDRRIPEWPEAIVQRIRIGDWEGDTIYGGVGKGFLVTLVDRKSRFLCAGIILSRNATETREAIQKLLKGLPVHSLSLDNGSEFAEFKELEAALEAPIYFAEPHKPWQRGTNENTNDILRFFFPKGFDFRSIDDTILQAVVQSINNRPRKCLNWDSPAEVFFSVALA